MSETQDFYRRLWADAAQHQEKRREVDPWETTLRDAIEALAPTATGGDGRIRVTADALFSALGIEIARRDRPAQMRVSQTMQRLGFTRANVWDSEKKGTTIGYSENVKSSLGEETEE